MLPQAGYSNDPPQRMYTANRFIPDEPGHGTDRSSILDQTSVAGYPGIEGARGYGHAFDISSTVDQAPLLMGNGVEYQHGHRGQNIVPQQDTGFGQTGSPSMGTSAQDPMTSLDDKTSQLQRLAKHALELSKELFDFSRSSKQLYPLLILTSAEQQDTNSLTVTRMPNGTPNAHARATRQRQEAIGGHLETLANLNCRLYNMLKQDCLKQYSMRSSEQARFLPSPNIASSSTGRSAVDAQPLGSMQYMPAAHALNSNTEVPVHPHDNNALGQSLAAANQSTSKGKEGKSKSKKGNKKGGDDDGDGAVSWHVPGKPARGTTDWRFLRDLAKNNPEKFIADYPNDLHDDMLWLIAEQHNYNRLKKFVDKVRSHHPGFEEFAAPPKPPQNASKKEKKAWVDKFKNRFCKALSRSGEKFGLTGKYKWDVFEPKAGWLDVHRWRENDCPKIIPYTKEEKKAMREAKKVKDARDAILNAVAASNTTETGTSSHGEASDEGEGNLAFSESEVLASVNHGPFQEEVEQVQPMVRSYPLSLASPSNRLTHTRSLSTMTIIVTKLSSSLAGIRI
jgi:hypothetical protein